MAVEGVAFTESAGDRIAKSVRFTEGMRKNGRAPRPIPAGSNPAVKIVRVTSATSDGPRYPAIIEKFRSDLDPPLDDIANSLCYLVSPSGLKLGLGTYLALLVGLHTDGRAIFAAEPNNTAVVVYILGIIVEGHLDSCSNSASASSSVFVGTICRPVFYRAVMQVFDEDCEVWNNIECVYAMEISGKRLEVNTRYLASFIGFKTKYTEAHAVPANDPCSMPPLSDVIPTKVYAVDAGYASAVIEIAGQIGGICNVSGSGSTQGFGIGGTDGHGNRIIGQCDDQSSLILYSGFIKHWDSTICGYVGQDSEPVYVAELNGRILPTSKVFLCHYSGLIPLSILEGSASDSSEIHLCRALYLTECAGYTGARYVYGPPIGGGFESGSGSNSGKPKVVKFIISEQKYQCGNLVCIIEHLEFEGDFAQFCTQVSLCTDDHSGNVSASPTGP